MATTARRQIDPSVFAHAFTPWPGGAFPGSYGEEEDAPEMSMATPPSSSFGASAFAPSSSQPDVTRDIYAPQLHDVGEKLSAAFQPPKLGFGGNLRALAGALVSRRNPQLGSIISGDYGRMRNISALQNQYKLIEDAINQNRAMNTADLNAQNVRSEISHRGAQEGYWNKLANAKENPPAKTPEEQAYQDQIDKGIDPLEALGKIKAKMNQIKPSEEDKALSDYLQAHNLPDSPANRDKARSALKTRDRKATDPEITDLNKQLKQAQLTKALEPTADEQRRADLARNMNENLDQLEDIIKRRPELFGPVAGRMTQAKQFFGTSDPDVAKLKAVKEYLGMASVGAHAMRNAQHVGTAADAVMGGFTNSPDAIRAAIGTARKSTATFLADEKRRGNKALGGGTEQVDPNDPEGLFKK